MGMNITKQIEKLLKKIYSVKLPLDLCVLRVEFKLLLIDVASEWLRGI